MSPFLALSFASLAGMSTPAAQGGSTGAPVPDVQVVPERTPHQLQEVGYEFTRLDGSGRLVIDQPSELVMVIRRTAEAGEIDCGVCDCEGVVTHSFEQRDGVVHLHLSIRSAELHEEPGVLCARMPFIVASVHVEVQQAGVWALPADLVDEVWVRPLYPPRMSETQPDEALPDEALPANPD